MQNRVKVHKLCRHKKGKKSKKRKRKETTRPKRGGRRICGRRGRKRPLRAFACGCPARRDCAQVRAQRSELVAALVLPVHCQLAISGRSTPCAAMYCRCSTSLSRICCTA